MLKSHEKFHSANGKRQVLVVDDELINREMLGAILDADYDVIYAEDGESALRQLRENQGKLSLMLLDLLMPGMSGLELLKEIKSEPELMNIPVIVITSEQKAEVESLSLGASDFIQKPYPQPAVILARVLRTIELSEDREIIQSTERDPLTGLYNREYFYRYAEQYDNFHKDTETDAIVIDVNHFHMINERYGKAYGDDVLRRIGLNVRDVVHESGGIVCRRDGDTFLVYCPHREDYKEILQTASVGLAGETAADNRVRLRMGVYMNVDKSLDIERRFDRAKMASDTVRGSFSQAIAYYDSSLHKSEVYAEQLLEDFYDAIKEHQFKVFYQPKFDIRPEIPVLGSAEALVRWQHPKLGMISPGIFIPLFEANGLIRELDNYVWREAAAQIKDWKDRFGFVVPVSVNVSRIDMYDPELVNIFSSILADNGLTPHELLLEITESAYTRDSEQIIEKVNQLRELGFKVEMDDFGTGYSSLNMISRLPIDALKLDMQFIRTAFSEKRDTRMLEVIIDIADYLTVPTIAEGVETEEQYRALKAMGCDYVQGYYFSKPVPADDYEKFVVERRELGDIKPEKSEIADIAEDVGEGVVDVYFGKITHALSSGFESIYYVDTESDHYVEFSSQGRYEDLQIQRSGADFFADTQENIPRAVYADDRERLSLSMRKDTLLSQLVGGRHFSMTYRLVIGGTPMYYNLKAVRANTTDNHHIVIGVSNVDEQTREAISEGEQSTGNISQEFISIAQALSSDFESIYYIDVESDTYSRFTSQGDLESLDLHLTGTDFFNEFAANISGYVVDEDRDTLLSDLNKEKILAELEENPTFSTVFRIKFGETSTFYLMKAMRAKDDGDHIVIGISNINEHMKRREAENSIAENSFSYTRIAQALAQDYFAIYFVNTVTEKFMEFSVTEDDHSLKLIRTGDGFYDDCRRSIIDMVPGEDRDKALSAFTRESLESIDEKHTKSISYRLNYGGKQIYASLKAIRLSDDPQHVVIGMSDISEQVKKEKEFEEAIAESVTYSGIAQALAADYFSIYYVDTDTDGFVEYRSSGRYAELEIEESGSDFFTTCVKNIDRVIYPEDRESLKSVMTKENIIAEIERNGFFTYNYRLMMEGQPVHVSLKATRMSGRGNHIVIGVTSVEVQIRQQQEIERAKAQSLTYSGIAQALAQDYFSIYYVDTETNEFIEYSSQSDYKELQVEQNGTNFFEDCRKNIIRLVYPEDISKALTVWDKDNLMRELERGKPVSATYRLIIDGNPVYINCKVIRMTNGVDDRHIVIGVSNVDAQVRREAELGEAREKAYRDPLTGVKTKFAYTEAENEINAKIARGEEGPFAVAVCDLNDVKRVNDSLGHQAGDRYIKDGSMIICHLFAHSPVYRFGGDEFVIIMRGYDYERRDELMSALAEIDGDHERSGEIIIAGGMSEYIPGKDGTIKDVFERADALMYENKTELKSHRENP